MHRGCLVLFGGAARQRRFNDTWEFGPDRPWRASTLLLLPLFPTANVPPLFALAGFRGTMDAFFIISSIIAVAGAFLVVSQRVAIYSLLGLLISFAGTAGIFYSLDAAFVAVSQILIYAGAIAVLFLFVLMFASDPPPALGPLVTVEARKVFKPAESTKTSGRAMPRMALPAPLALVISIAALAMMYLAIYKLPARFSRFGELPAQTQVAMTSGGSEQVDFGSTRAISYAIFDKFPLAFEVVSLLIFAAILGAVLLTRRYAALTRAELQAQAAADEAAAKEAEHA
jgi:NADH-quinone oxidoreductase subunit J